MIEQYNTHAIQLKLASYIVPYCYNIPYELKAIRTNCIKCTIAKELFVANNKYCVHIKRILLCVVDSC
jgi:hypothetical protein